MVTADRPQMLNRQAAVWAAVRGDLAAIGLIAAAVLASMRDTVMFGKVANADALALWLPVWTYLGRALRAGHIPLWQSNLMGGAPFASDAQSGWGYIEPSVLFVLLSPDHAIRTMLVLQPLTAGIGLYFLLRVERLPRWAACCGGLALSMTMTGSTLVDALPFSASLAWTVLTLLACSRLLAARTWARRLVWMVPTAIAWGQIAAAHAGLGLLMGSVSIIAYVVTKLIIDVHKGRLAPGQASAIAATLAVSAAAVNLAYFAPRLAYVDETSLGMGYGPLRALGRMLAGFDPLPYQPGFGAGWGWPLKLSAPPGAYLGGAMLIAVFLAFSSRYRRLAWTFAAVTAFVYVTSLTAFISVLPHAVDDLLPVDLYLHAPWWLGYEIVLSLSVLGAIGLTAWPRVDLRTRRAAGVAAVGVWIVLPVAMGVSWPALAVATLGIAIGLAALELARRRSELTWVVPCVLAVELVLAGTSLAPAYQRPIAVGPVPPRLTPPARGTTDVDPVILDRSIFQSYLAKPGTGRVVVISNNGSARAGKPYGLIGPGTEPAWLLDWPLLSGAQSAGGYEAVELRRYWVILRALGGAPANYEHATFTRVPHTLANLLRVQWVLRPSRGQPQTREHVVRFGPTFSLFRRPVPEAASLFGSWRSVRKSTAALAYVWRTGFKPNKQVVIEGPPGSGNPGKRRGVGTAVYKSTSPETATVAVQFSPPAAAPDPHALRLRVARNHRRSACGCHAGRLHRPGCDRSGRPPRGQAGVHRSMDHARSDRLGACDRGAAGSRGRGRPVEPQARP